MKRNTTTIIIAGIIALIAIVLVFIIVGGNEKSSEIRESGGSGEENEAAMSSPITPLDQSWNGRLGDLDISTRYDTTTQSVHTTVRNPLSRVLCYVQVEPHIKLGTKTVGELGPDELGHLSPKQEAISNLSVTSEPGLEGVNYDGYVSHVEVFDCSSSGPMSHEGEETESGGEDGSEHNSSDEESGETANALAPDETFDHIRSGIRLIMKYDTTSNSFEGTAENTTGNTVHRVRVEVHLSGGIELGPTIPRDVAPGETIIIELPSTSASFDSWVTHAEFGSGDSGNESGGEHNSNDEESGGR